MGNKPAELGVRRIGRYAATEGARARVCSSDHGDNHNTYTP